MCCRKQIPRAKIASNSTPFWNHQNASASAKLRELFETSCVPLWYHLGEPRLKASKPTPVSQAFPPVHLCLASHKHNQFQLQPWSPNKALHWFRCSQNPKDQRKWSLCCMPLGLLPLMSLFAWFQWLSCPYFFMAKLAQYLKIIASSYCNFPSCTNCHQACTPRILHSRSLTYLLCQQRMEKFWPDKVSTKQGIPHSSKLLGLCCTQLIPFQVVAIGLLPRIVLKTGRGWKGWISDASIQ